MKKVSTILLAAILTFALMACASDKKSEEAKTPENQTMAQTKISGAPDAVTAPDFTLQDAEGNDLTLSSYKGKVIILDFWATWCPPCRMEIPHFIELQETYGDSGLQVIGVSVDQQGWEAVRPFIQQYKINYPVVLLTNSGIYNAYQNLLPANERGGIPFTFVIDRNGRIQHQYVGYRDKKVFEEAVKPLL
jgi:cytochrome c biogenesis protein CcmG/thiol:disulfide interchange protein DsbE